MFESRISRPTNSALLSVSCGIRDKYILQVFKKELQTGQGANGKLRLFLSDGSALMCAEIDSRSNYNCIKEYSILRVELRYNGLEQPLQILSMEIIQADYQYLFGSPIPFIDFLNRQSTLRVSQDTHPDIRQNSQHQIQESDSITVRRSSSAIVANSDIAANTRLALQVEDIDRILDGSSSRQSRSGEQQKLQSDEYSTIAELYPKMRYWKLLARVTWLEHKICKAKQGIKSGQNILVINFFILDATGEIKCSLFDEAATRFKDVLKKHCVYEFSSGTLIEEVAHSNGSSSNFSYPRETTRKGLTIRFEKYSKIIEKTGVIEAGRLPLNLYKLVRFDDLLSYDSNTEVDVAGIVKGINSNESTISQKKRITFIISDPFMKKEVEVAAYFELSEADRLEVDRVIVLKNVKIAPRENNLVLLRSCYNTQLVTEFGEDEEPIVSNLLDYAKAHSVQPADFDSLSDVKFYRRSIKQLNDVLELCERQQNVCSKIQCYFTGVSDERKFTYLACYKCNKKVSINNQYSSMCGKCKKIVEVKEQFLLQCLFADHTDQIRISVMGDHAKKLLKIDPQEFSILSHEQQCARVQSLEFTQVCLLLRSSKTNDSYQHSIYGIEQSQIDDNMERIRRYVQEHVKEEDQT